MLIAPSTSSISLLPNPEMSYFAQKYGFHGTLIAIRDRSMALMEVYQLKFDTVFHHPKKGEQRVDIDGGSINEATWNKHKIPDHEYAQYMRALCKNYRIYEAYCDGLQYNQPLGNWVEVNGESYKDLQKLNVVGYS